MIKKIKQYRALNIKQKKDFWDLIKISITSVMIFAGIFAGFWSQISWNPIPEAEALSNLMEMNGDSFGTFDRKRIKDFKLESVFMGKTFKEVSAYEYDFEQITRNICKVEGIKMEVYDDIGTPTTYCGIPLKNRHDWGYQNFYWAAHNHITKASKIIIDIYGNVTPERMEGLLSWDYNTPQTRPVLRNQKIINAVRNSDREYVKKYMFKYNVHYRGHAIRRSHELDLIFN